MSSLLPEVYHPKRSLTRRFWDWLLGEEDRIISQGGTLMPIGQRSPEDLGRLVSDLRAAGVSGFTESTSLRKMEVRGPGEIIGNISLGRGGSASITEINTQTNIEF